MKEAKKFHQGDVQMYETTLPEGAKKIEKTFFAKSEKSGHAHALCGDYETYEHEGKRFVVVGSDGATLNHTGYQNLTPEYWNKNQVLPVADHKPTIIPAGTYFVGIQQEFDPYGQFKKNTLD